MVRGVRNGPVEVASQNEAHRVHIRKPLKVGGEAFRSILKQMLENGSAEAAPLPTKVHKVPETKTAVKVVEVTVGEVDHSSIRVSHSEAVKTALATLATQSMPEKVRKVQTAFVDKRLRSIAKNLKEDPKISKAKAAFKKECKKIFAELEKEIDDSAQIDKARQIFREIIDPILG